MRVGIVSSVCHMLRIRNEKPETCQVRQWSLCGCHRLRKLSTCMCVYAATICERFYNEMSRIQMRICSAKQSWQSRRGSRTVCHYLIESSANTLLCFSTFFFASSSLFLPHLPSAGFHFWVFLFSLCQRNFSLLTTKVVVPARPFTKIATML